MAKSLILIFILFFFCTAPQSKAAEMNAPVAGSGSQVHRAESGENIPDPPSIKKKIRAAVSDNASGAVLRLSLSELIHRVAVQNHQLQIQKKQWAIRQVEAEGAKGIFEPELVTSAAIDDSSQKNTVEESLSRLFTETYDERNQDYGISVQGLIPTGGKYDISYDLSRLSNSLNESLVDEDQEYRMGLGIRFRQPLLKNAGVTATEAAIHIAEKESAASFQAYRREMMAAAGDAANTYWDYYYTLRNMELRAASVRIAEKIRLDNRERHKAGKMAETEVFEAMAGLEARKALLLEAQHARRNVANRLATLLSIDAFKNRRVIETADEPVTAITALDRDTIVNTALQALPEYLDARERAAQADIRLAFAENQRRPELDLVASYGLNGLDFAMDDAWDQLRKTDFDSWSVGLEFRIPLGGGIETGSRLKKAQLEVENRLLSLKKIEIEIFNTIDTAIHNVISAEKQYRHFKKIVDIRKRLFNVESARLDAGKSGTRSVLEKEDEYRTARENALRNRVKLQKAGVQLELAGGTILMNNGVEIMEIK